MEKTWRIVKNGDGSVLVVLSNRATLLIKNDGITGYDFVDTYLRAMQRNHKNHLIAADLILQRIIGERYGRIRKNERIYRSNLALVSMGCAFASCSTEPAYAEGKGFCFQQSDCALRGICPFNGYHPSNKEKRLVCCNPIHELPLSAEQLRIANLLVNSSLDLKEMAEAVCLSESRVRVIASNIYSALGVESRQELSILLRGKRII